MAGQLHTGAISQEFDHDPGPATSDASALTSTLPVQEHNMHKKGRSAFKTSLQLQRAPHAACVHGCTAAPPPWKCLELRLPCSDVLHARLKHRSHAPPRRRRRDNIKDWCTPHHATQRVKAKTACIQPTHARRQLLQKQMPVGNCRSFAAHLISRPLPPPVADVNTTHAIKPQRATVFAIKLCARQRTHRPSVRPRHAPAACIGRSSNRLARHAASLHHPLTPGTISSLQCEL